MPSVLPQELGPARSAPSAPSGGTTTPIARVQVKAETGKALASLVALQRQIANEGMDSKSHARLEELVCEEMLESPGEIFQMIRSGELRLGPQPRTTRSEARANEKDETHGEGEKKPIREKKRKEWLRRLPR